MSTCIGATGVDAFAAKLPPSRPRREHDNDDLGAIKGIIAGGGLSTVLFWLPLAIELLRLKT